jgi:hypothetical protein
MLVGPDDRRVDVVHLPIELPLDVSLPLHHLQNLVLQADLRPPIEAAVHGGPPPVPLGKVTPGRARPANPQYAVDHGAVVTVWASVTSPLLVGSSLHTFAKRAYSLSAEGR